MTVKLEISWYKTMVAMYNFMVDMVIVLVIIVQCIVEYPLHSSDELKCHKAIFRLLFKPDTHSQRPHVPGFLKLFLFTCGYVSVCPPPRTLIISGMTWCDIDSVIG